MLNIKSLLTKILTNIIPNQNLLRGTVAMNSGSGAWNTSTFRNSGSGGTIAYNQSITPPSGYNLPTRGVIITATSANAPIGFCQDQCPIEKKPIVFSVWVKGNSGDRVDLQPIWSGTSGETESGVKSFTLSDSNWIKLEWNKTPNYAHTSVSLGYIYYYAAAASNTLQIIGPKLEYGNVSTPYNDVVQMTGALKTSFMNSEIIGSKQATQTASISNLITELDGKYQMGSVYLSSAYTDSGITIPSAWYNYISLGYIIILMGMTVSRKIYVINKYGNIFTSEIQHTNNISKGNMTNGTTTYYNLNGIAGTHYYYVKQGNKVTVSFNVKCTSPSSSMTQFASGLPTHNHPTAFTFPLACAEAGSYRPIWAQINSDGTIYASLGSAGHYYYGSFCYITNSS